MKKEISYINQINAFERSLETNYLPAASQLLWYKLMAIFNRCHWPEWISVDNRRLMSEIQVCREATFIEIRRELLTAGLLEYEKGKKSCPCRYKLVPLTFTGEVYPVAKSVTNTVANTVTNSVTQTVDIIRPIPKPRRNVVVETTAHTSEVDLSPEESGKRDLIGYVNSGLNEMGQTVAADIDYFLSRGMDAGVIRAAVDAAVDKHKPWRYAKGILTNQLNSGQTRLVDMVKPTLQEVREYCLERGKGVDPQRFFDYYEANGWMRGKVKMQDWKAVIRLWEGREKDYGGSKQGIEAPTVDDERWSKGALY